MPRLHLFCVLLTAAFLSLGQAAAAHAAVGEVTERAELVPSSSHITGAALPAHFIPAAVQAALDLRGVHPGSSVPGYRDRSRGLHGRRSSSSAASREPLADYVVARLLRGGIDNSNLGTPPPQS